MRQRSLGQGGDILGRRRKAAMQQGPRPHGQHQRLSRTRARTPGEAVFQLTPFRLARTASTDEVENRLDHLIAHRHAADHRLGLKQLRGIEDLARLGLGGAGGGQEDLALDLAGRVIDIDLDEETVEL